MEHEVEEIEEALHRTWEKNKPTLSSSNHVYRIGFYEGWRESRGLQPEFTNGLSPAQTERFAFLAEEMGEALQLIGKILRHGLDSYDPTIEETLYNRNLLEEELGQVKTALQLLTIRGDLREHYISQSTCEKYITVQKWLHHEENKSVMAKRAHEVAVLRGETGFWHDRKKEKEEVERHGE